MSKRSDPQLLLHTSPFLRKQTTTPRIMLDVIGALMPALLAAMYFFGVTALLVTGVTVLGCVGAEWAFGPKPRGASLHDGSAVLTGIVLALTLPPGVPLWIAFLGGAMGMILGKLIFGGLGQNLFNPALVGRAFLQAAFPTVMTTWTASGGPGGFFSVRPESLAAPLMQAGVDAIATATPLAQMKFEHESTEIMRLLVGNTSGSLGETSAVMILLAGAYLVHRRAFDWRIPVSIVLTVAIGAGLLYAFAPDRFPTPWFMVFSGGLLFGAVFMATDPVTSPMAPRGAVVFGVGVGVLVVLIRLFGGLPEGVMYSILLMNSATPLIERWTQPTAFGHTETSRS